jgi:hypothetical protein
MEWTWVVTTTLPVLIFMAGLWWNRRDADRREDRAFHRVTIVELQDAMGLMWRTASGGGSGEEYRAAWLRTLTLSSRLTNFTAKELVHRVVAATDATVEAHEARDSYGRRKAGTKRREPWSTRTRISACFSATRRGAT